MLGVFDSQVCRLEHHIVPHAKTGKASGGFDQNTHISADIAVGVRFTVELDRAAAFVDQTADDLLGGRFSTSVLTDKAVNCSLGNGHIKSVYSLLCTEIFS